MARLFAQFCTLVFVAICVVGFFLGDAGHVVNGVAQGNFGGVTLHLTYVRDVVNAIFLLLFIYVGFFAPRRSGKRLMLAAGVVLLGVGLAGFARGDNDAASLAIAGLNFPTAVNIFDTVIGVLAILAALGTLDDAEVESAETRSLLRDG